MIIHLCKIRKACIHKISLPASYFLNHIRKTMNCRKYPQMLMKVRSIRIFLLCNLYFTICPTGHLVNFANLIAK